ncbi:MAG: efflux RND transporter periplasmic adaptor subunit [Ignavibacteriaceae bacterium]
MKAIKYLMIILVAAASLISISCGEEKENGAASADKTYYCPMHPEVTSNKPGVCPICHMDLVLKSSDEAMEEHLDEGLVISNRKQVLANVAVVKVKKENISKTVTAYSYLDFAEQNRKLVTAKFNGRIEKLYVDRTGEYIRKGEPLFDIYSPDLVQAQNEYLIIANGFRNTSLVSAEGVSRNEDVLLNAAEQKLKLYGLTDKQIHELRNTKKVNYNLTYYSPVNGTVIEKKIQEGTYVNEGTIVYDVADLSELWNIAEVYENDLHVIKNGDKVQLKLNSYPGETFEGRVNLIYPVVNPETRTIKIRSSFPNKGNKLKPNMYGETVFTAGFGEGLVIPEEAVLFTGKRNLVWIRVKDKTFIPREVTVGTKFNGKYQVISGISEGEEVASSGAYLLDSESQLKSGLSGTGHEQHNVPQDNNQNKNDVPSEQKEDHLNHENMQSSSMEIWNKVCPVLGGKVNPKVETVLFEGKTIGFCCPGCDKDFSENPEKYLSNLSSDGKRFTGEK